VVHGATGNDDRDLVDGQLHLRRLVSQGARPAQLADRDQLEEGSLAGVLQHERPRSRRGPRVRVEREAGRPFQLLAAMERGGRRRGRLRGDDRHRRAASQAHRVPGPAQGPVGGVEIAILDLDLAGAPGGPERPDRAGGRQAGRRDGVGDAVLELQLDVSDRHQPAS
jgi:hypothetical protein